jgi:hypothetical protein
MKLDPGMHIGMHLVSFGKSGVTVSLLLALTRSQARISPCDLQTFAAAHTSSHETGKPIPDHSGGHVDKLEASRLPSGALENRGCSAGQRPRWSHEPPP